MANITEKTKAIVIQTIRYGDSSLIVKMLTEEYGVQSYMVKGVYRSKSKFRAALFQNMTILDIVATSGKASLAFIKEISLAHNYNDILFNVKKSSIILFMCELLSKSLPEAETDKLLFNYVYDTLLRLDEADDNYANFPLVFAMGLCHYLGFSPNTDSYKENSYFDIFEGRFTKSPNALYPIDNELSKDFYNICSQDIKQINLNINNKKRRQLLEVVVYYYKLHIDNVKEIQSYEILREIFE